MTKKSIKFMTSFHYTIFCYSIGKMKESGQLDRVWKKWSSKFRKNCLASDESSPLAMTDVYMAFVLLLVAFGLAIILALVEKLKSRERKGEEKPVHWKIWNFSR